LVLFLQKKNCLTTLKGQKMTFSIVAHCPISDQFAVAVASSSPAVAARCAHARAGIGAVTTQNVTDPRLGPAALDLLDMGLTATEACVELQEAATYLDYRQFTLIDSAGVGACFTGAQALGVHGQKVGRNVVSAGNLLAHSGVPAAIVRAFEAMPETDALGARVLAAMQAGLAAGGEAGPVKSAGLIVVHQQLWPIADLRVDWDDDPLRRLAELWEVWRPQMQDYVTRALDPTAAPSYGVPGDE
jgi:uncharacterized Ntn-hydrolase superfamily protein